MLLSVSSALTPNSWVAVATAPHSLVCCDQEGRAQTAVSGNSVTGTLSTQCACNCVGRSRRAGGPCGTQRVSTRMAASQPNHPMPVAPLTLSPGLCDALAPHITHLQHPRARGLGMPSRPATNAGYVPGCAALAAAWTNPAALLRALQWRLPSDFAGARPTEWAAQGPAKPARARCTEADHEKQPLQWLIAAFVVDRGARADGAQQNRSHQVHSRAVLPPAVAPAPPLSLPCRPPAGWPATQALLLGRREQRGLPTRLLHAALSRCYL